VKAGAIEKSIAVPGRSERSPFPPRRLRPRTRRSDPGCRMQRRGRAAVHESAVVLRPNPRDIAETFAEPSRRYMKAIGWEEGRNIRFLFVWAQGRSDRATRTRRPACRTECRSHYPLRRPRHTS